MPLFGSRRPQPRPAFLLWSYKRIPPGHTVRGWIAGPYVGVQVHWSGSSKPCRAALTDGQLECRLCKDHAMKYRWIGYLPLWDHGGKRTVVCVSETVAPLLDQWGFGTQVSVGRSVGARDPLRLAEIPQYERSKFPETMARAGPQDITPWLLHLWQDADLSSFFKAAASDSSAHNASSETPAPPVESEAVPPPSSPARNGHAAPQEPAGRANGQPAPQAKPTKPRTAGTRAGGPGRTRGDLDDLLNGIGADPT